MSKTPLVELKATRKASGGTPNTSINRHSCRHYRHGNDVYRLDRNLSGVPPFYNVTRYIEGEEGKMTIWPALKIEGEENWGDGYPWSKAERALMEELEAAGIQRDSGESDEFVKRWMWETTGAV